MIDLVTALARIAVALERMADAAEAESRAARLLTEAMRLDTRPAARSGESPGAQAQRDAEEAIRRG